MPRLNLDQARDVNSLTDSQLAGLHFDLHVMEELLQDSISTSNSPEDFFSYIALDALLSDMLEMVHARIRSLSEMLTQMIRNDEQHAETNIINPMIDAVNLRKVEDINSGRFADLALFTPIYRDQRAFLRTATNRIQRFSDAESDQSLSSGEQWQEFQIISLPDSPYSSRPDTPNNSLRDSSSETANNVISRTVTPTLSRNSMFSKSSDSSSSGYDSDTDAPESSRGFHRI